MSSMEKTVARRTTDTSRSSGKARASVVDRTALSLMKKKLIALEQADLLRSSGRGSASTDGIRAAVEKFMTTGQAERSRFSGGDRASRAGTTAVEDRREPALTIGYLPEESHDIEADIEFVDGVDGPRQLSHSWRDSETIPSLFPTEILEAHVLPYYHYALGQPNAFIKSVLSAYLDACGLEERLGTMPYLRAHTYDRILADIDMSYHHQLLQMMAVTLFAVRPLTMQEFRLVVDISDPVSSFDSESTSKRQERRERKLLTWSQGLLSVQFGLAIFINTLAHGYVKNPFMSRRVNSGLDGDMMVLRAYLLYLQKLQEQMEKCCCDTNPELSHAEDALLWRFPFFRYAIPFSVLDGISVRRRIDPCLFDMENPRMHGSHFEVWKSRFRPTKESLEGHMTQQEVKSYFLARFSGAAPLVDLDSQMKTQTRSLLGVEEADFPDSKCAFGPNLGFRSADRENGANDIEVDPQESYTNPIRSQGTVAARSDKLDHLSVEDGFSPIILEQESALGIDLLEASKIRKLLLALFINDDVLRPIYKTALETMSPGNFERKFHVLLGSFAYDLQEEAHEVHEQNISSFCHSNGICMARYIRILFTKESSACDDTIRQLQLQLPDIRGSLVPILSALWSSQTHGKNSNIVHQLERFVTNSKAFVTLRMGFKILAEPTISDNSSAPNRQASAAVPMEKRSPMLEEGTNVPSNASQNVETLDIRQALEYRSLFVGSSNSQLLDPPLALNRSLLFRSYRYITSQVLGFLQGLNLYEPPLPANCVRLQWICVCGNLFFRDFVLPEVSSAYGLRDLLLHSGYQAALFVNPCNFQAVAQGSDVLRESSATSVNNQGTQPGLPSGHTAKPSNPNQSLGGKMVTPDDSSEVLERDNGLKAMWIIICLYYNRHVSQAVHLDTQVDDDDVSLIKHARQKYFEKRGWFAYYMSWKAVTKIAFVKFAYILDPIIEEELALLHEDWVPPKGWKDTKLWEPCPAEPRPMAEQRFLLHLWDHPHNSRPYLIVQTTKLRLIGKAKSLLTRLRVQKLHRSRWLREIWDRFKRFRGWNTASEQLPFSNPNNLQRIDDPGDSALRATGKGRYLFRSTPKRLETELKAHLDEPPLGWGLHFEESIVVPAPLRYLGIFIVIAIILSVVVSALVLVHEKGVAYFGMGNFGIGIAAVVTTVVLRLIAV